MLSTIFLFVIANLTLLIEANSTFQSASKRPFVAISKSSREDSFCTWKYCEVLLSFCKEIKTAKEEKQCKVDNRMVVRWSKSYIRRSNMHCCDWKIGNITSNYLFCVYGFYTKHCSCRYTIFKWTWDIRVKHCSNGFDCNFKKVTDDVCFDKPHGRAKLVSKKRLRDDKNMIDFK